MIDKEPIYKSIQVQLIQKREYDIAELIKRIKNKLKKANILINSEDLLSYNNKLGDSKGKFDDDIWIMKTELQGNFVVFDFIKLNELNDKGVLNKDVLFIKCWIIESILEGRHEHEGAVTYGRVEKLHRLYNVLYDFMKTSSNFSMLFLDSNVFILEDLFKRNSSTSYKKRKIIGILNYLNYIKEKVDDTRVIVIDEYIAELNTIAREFKISSVPRQLPGGNDILLFALYLEDFFNNKKVAGDLKLYFMPILLWWRITTIIPMRPSEFGRMLKRNCMIKDENEYYLKIERIKNRKVNSSYHLPLLTRVKLTDKLIDLINEYIEMTDPYGYSETLISFRALVELRKALAATTPQLEYLRKALNESRINMDIFTSNMLYELLDDFYDVVINGIYNDKLIKNKIRPGDTRHFAFTSLLKQGYSREEAAILGGHRTLSAIDNYTSSLNPFIDFETVLSLSIEPSKQKNNEVIDSYYESPLDNFNHVTGEHSRNRSEIINDLDFFKFLIKKSSLQSKDDEKAEDGV